MDHTLKTLQDALGHSFSDVSLLETALAHSSYTNELDQDLENNERLEFLGDAVLELVVSQALFNRYPEAREGHMTRMRARLVREATLAAIARELALDRCLRLGRGEEIQGGRNRDSLLSDGLEAVLGAVFLDAGFKAASQVIERLFHDRWPDSPEMPKAKDYKSLLQELTQRLFKARPVYTLVKSEGPEHAKVFEVRVDLPSGEQVLASGQSLKKAQQKAARTAMELLQDRE